VTRYLVVLLIEDGQYSLFSLGMFTYIYERQDIIQIALKILLGRGESAVKKG
jgi:hypothetical protein